MSDKSVEVRKFGGVELVEPEASVPATWLAECRTMVKESALARHQTSSFGKYLKKYLNCEIVHTFLKKIFELSMSN